ncbi:MAG: hypothetical protein AB8G96_14715 [Phycisphaerales bacterium]
MTPRCTTPFLTAVTLAATAATAVTAATATAAEPVDVQSRLERLESEVTRLQGVESELADLRMRFHDQANGIDRSEARADEVRAIVAEVMADADARSSMLQSGGTAGWNNGFSLGSADGNYSLSVKGLQQFRYIHSLRDGSGDDSRGGFENQRTYLTFTGNVVDPTWIYKLQGGFNTTGGTFTLLDAYVAKVLDNGLILAAGQFKVPMLRESDIDEQGVQGTSRSLVTDEFDPRRTQGVALIYTSDDFKFTGGLTDGHAATGGQNQPWNNYDVEYSLTGRAEWLLAGTFAQFADITSAPGADYGLMIGGAVHYQAGENGTTANEIDAFQATIDISAEWDRANFMAYYVYRDVKGLAVDADAFVLQGGYYFQDDLEGYARFEYADNDVDADPLSIVTFGVNKYFAGNNAKFSADIGYALDSVTSFWGNGALGVGGATSGWQTDAAGEDGQMVVRAQFQLAF